MNLVYILINILVLHFSNEYENDDLRLVSEKREKVIENLVKIISIEQRA